MIFWEGIVILCYHFIIFKCILGQRVTIKDRSTLHLDHSFEELWWTHIKIKFQINFGKNILY